MSIQNYTIDYKDFLKRFKFIRHEKNLHFGEYILMKDKDSKSNVFVKVHFI